MVKQVDYFEEFSVRILVKKFHAVSATFLGSTKYVIQNAKFAKFSEKKKTQKSLAQVGNDRKTF